ncbi:MAG: hypothetical protein JSS66_06425 [Armatimonadetes bacterium]|nr:hypothetical protein [Armatimonadota bacterium]
MNEIIADVQRRLAQAVLQTPTGDLRTLLTDVNVVIEALKNPDLDRFSSGLRAVVDAGHDDHCIFCGFKDRVALSVLAGHKATDKVKVRDGEVTPVT